MDGFSHVSVLLGECIELLAIRPDGIYVDATLGAGGHTAAIAAKLTSGRVIGLDRDAEAVENAKMRFADEPRVMPVRCNFRDMADTVRQLGIDHVDGVLFDLGVSSPQLDHAERGFSYMADAPLDMRMDSSEAITARDVVNTYHVTDLERIFREYGEERYARRIAEGINAARQRSPIETTLELVDIIRSSMPGRALAEKQHPAKRTFQAIRIEVNGELTALDEGLKAAMELVGRGGRVCAISFHSLEDRIVKRAFAEGAKGCTCPPDFPVCVCGKTPQFKVITKSPVTAGEAELEANPRSRSAKLRAAEKL